MQTHADPVRRGEIAAAYRVLLDREPEGEQAYQSYQDVDPERLLRSIQASQEYREKNRTGPFWQFAATPIDILGLIRKYAAPQIRSVPGHLVNFNDVAIDISLIAALAGYGEGREQEPVPANWHACMAEWGAVLRAVDLAEKSMTVIEVGCGWGCWLNNAGRAAKRRGLATQLIGIDADKGHLDIARATLKTNEFTVRQRVRLHHAIAAAGGGVGLFPLQEKAGANWTLAPLLGLDAEGRQARQADGGFGELPVMGLTELGGVHPRIDLLHIDIGDDAYAFLEEGMDFANSHLAYLVAGTRSRIAEGRLFDLMLGNGWILEVERPTSLSLSQTLGPLCATDGVQGWRNPRLIDA